MSEPIPLSVLSLDHPEPPQGWEAFLGARGIRTELDDLGRWCVSRAAARTLLTEQFQAEAKRARLQAEADQRAEEADREFRASLNKGVPWWQIPMGVSPAEAIMRAGEDAERPRSVHEELLDAEFARGRALAHGQQ